MYCVSRMWIFPNFLCLFRKRINFGCLYNLPKLINWFTKSSTKINLYDKVLPEKRMIATNPPRTSSGPAIVLPSPTGFQSNRRTRINVSFIHRDTKMAIYNCSMEKVECNLAFFCVISAIINFKHWLNIEFNKFFFESINVWLLTFICN